MNILEIATGAKSSEYRVVLIIIAILGCQVLGIDAVAVLPLLLDGSDIVRYEELLRAMGPARVDPGGSAVWALALVGVGYPAARAYVKSLKAGQSEEPEP